MGLLEKLLLGGNALSGDIGEVLSGKNNLGKWHNIDYSPLLSLLRQKVSNFDFAIAEVITAKNNKIGGDIGDGLLNLTSISKYLERASF